MLVVAVTAASGQPSRADKSSLLQQLAEDTGASIMDAASDDDNVEFAGAKGPEVARRSAHRTTPE